MVISQRPKRQTPSDIDLEVYKWRHLIESFFGKLKEFKRIAMRSDKTDACPSTTTGLRTRFGRLPSAEATGCSRAHCARASVRRP